MILRAPAIPLITNDPYFSVWSTTDRLNEGITKHWTGKAHRITGTLTVNTTTYCFLGKRQGIIAAEQLSCDINALSTKYTFSCGTLLLEVTFTSPLLLDDLTIAARPLTYLHLRVLSPNGKAQRVRIEILVDDELCLNHKGEYSTVFAKSEQKDICWGRVGSANQDILAKSGDDIRINWGYFYLASNAKATKLESVSYENVNGTRANDIKLSVELDTDTSSSALIAFAYDDIKSIEYFSEHLVSYWTLHGNPIETIIGKALEQYPDLFTRCENFSATLYADAEKAGGTKYAELLSLAYRQAVAAHKICFDKEGQLLFISKECFSNGCAATVDVSYPSTPLFLLYNPELIKGMLRPIFKYAASDAWCFDFAPHDVGQYPILNGQVYGEQSSIKNQMPVEECGNMLIMVTALAIAQKDVGFAKQHWKLLEQWAAYLESQGMNPENQLCTDDFAGHLAHNCNLSLKAIMGIAGFAVLNQMSGHTELAQGYLAKAKSMAQAWLQSAKNTDGTFRLAFDAPDTFSMKYNAVWDMVFGTDVFPTGAFQTEASSYITKRTNPYGMPLDNRANYTKSDWLVWSAVLTGNNSAFANMIAPLWDAYNESESRVPLTDWYDTLTAKMVGFQNRTVQGGLFMKLLDDKGICQIDFKF